MAYIHVEYYSMALAGQANFYACIPNDVPPMMMGGKNPHYNRPTKTLILLHGYSGAAGDWVTGSFVRELANTYNLAIIMPDGRNSFYLDKEATGEKFATFVGEELPNYVHRAFGLSEKPEDNFIGGYSMGGFGALRTGLYYNHTFSKILALSSALIVPQLKSFTPDMKNPMANYAYYANIFGDLQTAEERDCNPEVVLKNKKAAGEILPAIYMACGTEDFLIERNQAFHEFLNAEGVEHIYKTSPGVHNWAFWNQYIEPGIQWMVAEDK